MTISELIAATGDANVRFQFLDASITNISTSKKGVSLVTFGTEEINATNVATGLGPVGLIVWLPREKFQQATAHLKN